MEAIRKALDEVDVDLIFVFLDLNFPDIQTGLATLNRLRRNSDDRVRQIPVFVYSISKDQSEVAAVQTRGGNGYFHKVDHPDTFWEALQTIDRSDASQWPRPGQAADVIKGRRPANDLASAQFLQ
ncbi:DNA-binding NarL/FixJ family response regulator [Granulicella aggregans]|uniref:DNA-binding NarL/FixJ family response regulator n=2 Tax=Granulicella aggregans TaxID=474949 RepID=A0A7W8E3N1_9BACT|nr:DNA-binding NarL/FixJ family response regulator [Granulicella aggregans]